MKKIFIPSAILFVSTISFAATDLCLSKAKTDATAKLAAEAIANGENSESLEIDGFQEIGKLRAISEMDSQGLVEGKEFHSSVSKLLAADKVYMIYSSIGNGSATDLVLVKIQNCSVTQVIRIQEE